MSSEERELIGWLIAVSAISWLCAIAGAATMAGAGL